MKHLRRIIASFAVIVTTISVFVPPAHASSFLDRIYASVSDWASGFSGQNTGMWNPVDPLMGWYTVNQPQKYYTTPSESVEDKYGNVINYYRGGDTTTTRIVDSYNKTFNNIWNTNNTTNNYSANVKLNDFLNTYTTVNNDYTYNTEFKSWYYDYDTNNYNYSDNRLYYNEDNSQYYITIDNSTDEYYLVDVQYSPTFVTVNYDYSTTNNNTTNNYGDVTNVYYFELTDGRNSSTLTASEVAGLDLGYDVTNYVLVPDDPNTLSLQHFDGNYEDSSSYGCEFYSENRSTQYVDAGAFGKAVKLVSGSAAGVTIPGLSDYDGLQFDFRLYFDDFNKVGIYFGDINLNETIYNGDYSANVNFDDSATKKTASSSSTYSRIQYTKDSGNTYLPWRRNDFSYNPRFKYNQELSSTDLNSLGLQLSTSLSDSPSVPTSYDQFNHLSSGKTGWFSRNGSISDRGFSDNFLCEVWGIDLKSDIGYSASYISDRWLFDVDALSLFPETSATNKTTWGNFWYDYEIFIWWHYRSYHYYWAPTKSVSWDFSKDNYKSQWVPFRIVIKDNQLHYFVNGDCVGSGAFDLETADKFYIKSSGNVILDELRVTTGDLVSTGAYTPSSEPYDTNMVLALPDDLAADTIYVRHSTPVSSYRIGGVRPSNPSTGFFYLPLHEDYTGGQSQLYDGSNWVDVVAMVYDGSNIKDVVGYKFSPVGASPDVDTDLQPGRPTKPGEDVDQITCTHTWEETNRKESTCTLNGSIEYTCSKCKATKSESIPKLGHTWEVKTSIQTTYDEQGNVVTQGYTIYRCMVCGEEFKDTEGTGPPQSNPSTDEGGENQGFLGWLGSKVGELFGAIGDGVIGLLKSALGKVLDGLISLVNMVFDKLKTIVDLFGGFGDALGVLWTWLPPEIVTVLVAAVTVFVFIALLKLFMK